jgi:hypothetical protein
MLLSVIDDQAAAESFVRLLRAHAAETSDMFELQKLRDKPHHADVFFPASWISRKTTSSPTSCI